MMGGMQSDQTRRGLPYPDYVPIFTLLLPRDWKHFLEEVEF